MATQETSIPSDPTQEQFAEAVLLSLILSITVDRALVDRALVIVDRHLETAKRGRT